MLITLLLTGISWLSESFLIPFVPTHPGLLSLLNFISVCDRSVDLALLVDGSAVVTQSDSGNYRLILNFLQDIVAKFDLGSGHTRVAAVVFGDVGQVVFYLDTFNTRVGVQIYV